MPKISGSTELETAFLWEAGLRYDSVRLEGGENVVAYRPRNVRDVVMGSHYELVVPLEGAVVARELSAER